MPNKENPDLVAAFAKITHLRDTNVITQQAWKIYEALWHYGPLPKKDLGSTLESWHKTPFKQYSKDLKFLTEKGLVSVDKGNFNVTAAQELTSVPPPPKKPSKKKFAKGVEDLEMALMRAERVGFATAEAHDVLLWVKSKVT